MALVLQRAGCGQGYSHRHGFNKLPCTPTVSALPKRGKLLVAARAADDRDFSPRLRKSPGLSTVEVLPTGLSQLLAPLTAIFGSKVILTVFHLENVVPDWLSVPLGPGLALLVFFLQRAERRAELEKALFEKRRRFVEVAFVQDGIESSSVGISVNELIKATDNKLAKLEEYVASLAADPTPVGRKLEVELVLVEGVSFKLAALLKEEAAGSVLEQTKTIRGVWVQGG